MRRPSPAILGSIALHAGVVALAFVSWSSKDEPKPLVNSVPVSIVSDIEIAAAPADNPQEEPSLEDGETAPVETPPEPTPPEPDPTPPAPQPRPTPPAPRPTPTPPEKKAPTPSPRPTPNPPEKKAPATPPRTRPTPGLDLDALAGPPRPTQNRGRPAPGQQGAGSAPRATGPQLAALGAQVTPNWNLNCDMPGMDDLVIRVTVRLSADGQIIGTPRLQDTQNDPTWRAASEAMLRALRATSPFTVPDGFQAQEVPFRFETKRQCGNR
ncbi:TonB C-terminal domain-containing protein [Brevundimonas diminuta]|uniref:TonB C-terminal domain-containing protein n=1 Tax=Brevundimonas diminuta TaxID=293 RepID=UPI0012F8F44D|nr:TonB C-terminal domain-containing protein [Brevundimonas diminuta]